MKRRYTKKSRRAPMRSMEKATRDMMNTTVGFMGVGLMASVGSRMIHSINEV
jgi:ABC-type transporter lipoprotein component MlaA